MDSVEIEVEVKGKKKDEYDEYELDSCLHTLEKAEEIKADPKKLKAVQEHAAKKVKKIQSIADLRAVKAERDMKDVY